MTSFGEKLRALREQKEITQEELGRILNVKKAAISKYESDKISMNLDSVKLLANYFGVPITYFLTNEPLVDFKVNKLPILGIIQTGVPILAQESYEGYLDMPDYIKADFVLTVVGDSMVGAGILDGDYAVCRESQVANSGQIVVALNDLATGFSEATLKYYFDNGNGPILRPANPDYQEISMQSGYQIAGIMEGLLRKESPGYQIYKNYLAVPGHEEWTEVIELATSTGIKPERMKSFIEMINEMGKGK